MTDPTSFSLEISAQEYPARCSFGDVSAIETACGHYREDGSRAARPFSLILRALMAGEYSAAEAVEPLRIALSGGGMNAGDFKALRDSIFEAEGMEGLAKLSLQVAQVAFVGVARLKPKPEPVPGDPPAPRETAPPPKPFDMDAVRWGLIQAGVSPEIVNSMSLADWTGAMAAAPESGKTTPEEAKAMEAGAARAEAAMKRREARG